MAMADTGTGTTPPAPPDVDDRQRIRTDLDHTLFVEAGAGAGKTSSLVDRVVNLVESGVSNTEIAAITFTEKAAAELRARLRTELATRHTESALQALNDLDHAPIADRLKLAAAGHAHLVGVAVELDVYRGDHDAGRQVEQHPRAEAVDDAEDRKSVV